MATVYCISTQFLTDQVSFKDRTVRLENREAVIQYLKDQFELESKMNEYIQKKGYDHFLRWARTHCDIYEINKKNHQMTMLKPADFGDAGKSKDIL